MVNLEVKLSKNALTVLEKRYLKKDEKGQVVETPEEMFWRVARAIAEAEWAYDPDADVEAMAEEFYKLMASLGFLPNSPTLMNAGTELGQLSACFVLPVEDSIESIFDAVKATALIHQSGGGTGFSFSRLRPRGDIVGSTGGVASGPISFMRVFDTATDVIKQGGRRRGANMGVLRVDHPDILEFITCKEKESAFSNFNISVAVIEGFMRALETKTLSEEYENKHKQQECSTPNENSLRKVWKHAQTARMHYFASKRRELSLPPADGESFRLMDDEYELVNPRTGEMVRKLRAREVFDRIVEGAWRNGEPGIIFLDRMNEFNPTPALGDYESSNPCGEQILLPHESCNLGSINLSRMLREGNGRTVVDWAKLERTVKLATRFLDNVISVNKFPLPEIEEATLKTRKIGLGVMGFADMLIALGIPYDSEEAEALASKIMEAINYWSKEASIELAKERGRFPAFEGSIYTQGRLPIPETMTNDQIPMLRTEVPQHEVTKPQPLIRDLQFDWPELIERIRKHGLRNATTTTIAPTGSISIIAGCSSGIEPIFALAYTRRHILDEDVLPEVNPLFEKVAKERGFYSEELMAKLAEKGNCQGLPEVPEDMQRVFATALDISPEWHVRMQAVFQRWVDNAVSKTINCPNSATKEDIAQAYLLAYRLGCKGVTVYRDRSRQEQVLTRGAAEAPTVQPPVVTNSLAVQLRVGREQKGERVRQVRPRPQTLSGVTYRIPTPLGTAFITVNENGVGEPFEVFANVGKAGSDTAAVAEAMGRLISLCLRLPSSLSPRERMREVVDQLAGIGGGRPLGFGPQRVRSLPDAIAQVLARHLGLIEEKAPPAQPPLPSLGIGDLCPECGQATFVEEEGCRRCYSCGFTEC